MYIYIDIYIDIGHIGTYRAAHIGDCIYRGHIRLYIYTSIYNIYIYTYIYIDI